VDRYRNEPTAPEGCFPPNPRGQPRINALGDDLYKGIGPSRYGRPRRIPGSVRVSAATLVDPAGQGFTTLADAEAKFTAKGVTPDQHVITTGGLNYTLTGQATGDNTLLMQKSDGSFWLALWNKSGTAHNITITAPGASRIEVFDPLRKLGAIQNVARASATVTMNNHPLLVEVLGAPTASGGPPPPPTPDPSDLAIVAPASETVTAGDTIAVTGVSISDPWAAGNPGFLALNVSDSSGTLSMAGHTGSSISLQDTLAGLNADLATLRYAAGSATGGDAITINVWNQAGVEVRDLIGVTFNTLTFIPNP